SEEMKFIKTEDKERLKDAVKAFEEKCNFELSLDDTLYALTEILDYSGNSKIIGVFNDLNKAQLKLQEAKKLTLNPVIISEYLFVIHKEEFWNK
ncbi:TPA: hypothetical protein LQO26_002466, partial [Staphylococcus pseudintermedius]|nr:hypothetical protein [Staphylococcus pseudintermedius]HCT0551978.1 hypothetical protein [Staphylococcus pseudintermedius]